MSCENPALDGTQRGFSTAAWRLPVLLAMLLALAAIAAIVVVGVLQRVLHVPSSLLGLLSFGLALGASAWRFDVWLAEAEFSKSLQRMARCLTTGCLATMAAAVVATAWSSRPAGCLGLLALWMLGECARALRISSAGFWPSTARSPIANSAAVADRPQPTMLSRASAGVAAETPGVDYDQGMEEDEYVEEDKALDAGQALDDEESEEDSTELAEDVLQSYVRRTRPDGGEAIEMQVRVDFAPDQRSQNVHVAFCPPLSTAPAVNCYFLDGPPARAKVAQSLTCGARIEVKLDRPAADACRLWLQLDVQTPGA